MNMSLRKLTALILSVLMCLSLLAGCTAPAGTTDTEPAGQSTDAGEEGEKEAEAEPVSELEPETVTMYLLGNKGDNFDDAYDKINEILKKKINTTVNVEWISWGEGNKYSLLFSGGEDFEMIFTASQWANYETTVALGGFAELTEEMLQKYAPDVWEQWPADAWTQAKINGKIYMIPANYVEVNQDVVAIRGDLMKKYGYDDINSYDQLLSFYEDCMNDGMYGNSVGAGSIYWLMFEHLGMYAMGGTPCGGQMVLYNCKDPKDLSYTYVLDWEPFVEYCKKMKELADGGCWPSDVLNTTSERQDGLVSGRGATMVWNAGSCQIYANPTNAEHPDWEINLYNIMPECKYRATRYINGGVGFNAASSKLERALMVYNEFATNPEIQNLAQLGIEGVNYIDVGDGTYKSTGNDFGGGSYWGWRNMNIMLKTYYEDPTPVDEKVMELDKYFKENLYETHLLDSFTFNPEAVATQVAAVDAVQSTYFDPLINGLVDDVDATIEEFKEALDYAGMQDILDELQRQIDEFAAANQ